MSDAKHLSLEQIQEFREEVSTFISHTGKWGYYMDFAPLLDTAEHAMRERDTLRAGIEAIVSDLDAISKHSDFCRTDCAILATKARKLLEAKDGDHE